MSGGENASPAYASGGVDARWEYMHGALRASLLAEADPHLHATAGFPFEPEAGECEVCDVLWLIQNDEGDRLDNFFHLRDALEEGRTFWVIREDFDQASPITVTAGSFYRF